NAGYYYYITLSLGTPGQDIDFDVTTGASDFWVHGQEDSYCDENCDEFVFDTDESSTFVSTSETFSLSYQDGRWAKGVLGLDTVHIGEMSVGNAMIAIANASNSTTPVIGLGYEVNESEYENGKAYTTLLQLLVDQGYIESKTYSIYLNNSYSEEGDILFGGYDSSRWSDYLYIFEVVPDIAGEAPTQLKVNLTDVTYNNQTLISGISKVQKALISEGSTYMFLPEVIVNNIINSIAVELNTNYYCDEISDTDTPFVFWFSDNVGIEVPIKNLVPPIIVNGSYSYSDGRQLCSPALAVSDSITLGLPFVRSAYVIFDLDSNLIGLGQAIENPGSENIV
ncbi:aspartic peptidase domain-containing protein, partial [Dipodascopsis tothii]|uniref:aspartic peptidase domain-containing protein n=1 Tax=Dipodascopsis tothii TaxID=44089 RepID=UPI0034CEF76A